MRLSSRLIPVLLRWLATAAAAVAVMAAVAGVAVVVAVAGDVAAVVVVVVDSLLLTLRRLETTVAGKGDHDAKCSQVTTLVFRCHW